ncbi:MAG: hypothetical protein U0792_08105 [Gemmataceae bacterium]
MCPGETVLIRGELIDLFFQIGPQRFGSFPNHNRSRGQIAQTLLALGDENQQRPEEVQAWKEVDCREEIPNPSGAKIHGGTTGLNYANARGRLPGGLAVPPHFKVDAVAHPQEIDQGDRERHDQCRGILQQPIGPFGPTKTK